MKLLAALLFVLNLSAVFAQEAPSPNPFLGHWALEMPDGAAGWLTISLQEEKLHGELWTVGGGKLLSKLSVDGNRLSFFRKVRVGKPKFDGGPPSGKPVDCRYTAQVRDNAMALAMHRPNGEPNRDPTESIAFQGKRMPPLPPKPDLSRVEFGPAIQLFNGKNLDGWRLTNPKQLNGWKAVNGELVNTTPKLDFAPYSRYGNLQTEREFADFNLKIEFKVPPGGNSGIYLRGVYETQVLDRIRGSFA